MYLRTYEQPLPSGNWLLPITAELQTTAVTMSAWLNEQAPGK